MRTWDQFLLGPQMVSWARAKVKEKRVRGRLEVKCDDMI